MNQRFVIGVSLLLVVVLCLGGCNLTGGKPQFEDFDAYSQHFQLIANICLAYYSRTSPANDASMLLEPTPHYLNYDQGNDYLRLTEEQKVSVQVITECLGSSWFLIVEEESVLFCQDERGKYALLYAHYPLIKIRQLQEKNNWDFNRINSNWYEVGDFGI